MLLRSIVPTLLLALILHAPTSAQYVDGGVSMPMVDALGPDGSGGGMSYLFSGGLFAEFEATMLRYHRADGLRVGTDGSSELVTPGAFDIGPRMTLGYQFGGGLGIRMRYWELNSDQRTHADVAEEHLDVLAYAFDLEAFERFNISEKWDLEISGGLRYAGYNEEMFDDEGEFRANHFYGLGGIGGAELRRSLGFFGAFVARGRAALVADDLFRENTSSGLEMLPDGTHWITEFFLGYEASKRFQNGSLLYGRIGGEWQQWQDFSSNLSASDEETWTGNSDVGFAGLTFSLGWRR